MYLNLLEKVVKVDGAVNSCIYDLNYKRLFSIDESGRRLLENLLNCSNAEQKISELSGKEEVFINFLLDSGLVSLSTTSNTSTTLVEPKKDLDLAWVELGDGCNHTCQHCYNFSKPDNRPKIELDTLKNAISQLSQVGIKKLKFIGGEPLVFRKDLEKLIHHAQNVKIDDISIHSNGTLLNNKLCVFFKENRVHLDVTIYSHIEITHDSITNTKGSWQQTLYGLEMLSSHGVDFSIVIIVLPENEKDLIQTQRELKRRFPNVTVNFDYTRPVGRAKDIYNQLEFTHLNRFQEHYSFFQGVSEEEFLERHFFNPCLSNKVRVSENGSIFPCIMMNESAGNIANTDIKSIIDSDKFNKYRKLPLSNIEVCRDCEFRYACTDCRPIAIGLTDNVFAKPPECKYDPFMGKINHIEYKNI